MSDTCVRHIDVSAACTIEVVSWDWGYHMLRVLMMAAVAVCLASCATPYTQSGFTGGFDVKELRPDVYRVSFQGNGYTSRETVQAYWLYRCAELAIEKGFTGFEILSDMPFVMRRPSRDDPAWPALSSSVASLRTRIPITRDDIADVSAWRPQGDLASRSDEPIRLARGGGAIFIYSGGGAAIPRPAIEGDVRFFTAPVEAAPPKIFNARTLKAQLDPIISAEKCGVGNLCPHVHEYLLPKGKLR